MSTRTARKAAAKPRTTKAAATEAALAASPWVLRSGVAQVASLWDVAPHLIHDVNGTCFRITPDTLSVKDRPELEAMFASEITRLADDAKAERVHLFCERCVVTRRNSVVKVREAKAEARNDEALALVAQVREYAQEHYNEGGWDMITETMSDEDLVRLIGRARTFDGALRKVGIVASEYADRRAEVVSA